MNMSTWFHYTDSREVAWLAGEQGTEAGEQETEDGEQGPEAGEL
jgi:hypothetical protein